MPHLALPCQLILWRACDGEWDGPSAEESEKVVLELLAVVADVPARIFADDEHLPQVALALRVAFCGPSISRPAWIRAAGALTEAVLVPALCHPRKPDQDVLSSLKTSESTHLLLADLTEPPEPLQALGLHLFAVLGSVYATRPDCGGC